MIRAAIERDIDAVDAAYTELLLHEQEHGSNTQWVQGFTRRGPRRSGLIRRESSTSSRRAGRFAPA